MPSAITSSRDAGARGQVGRAARNVSRLSAAYSTKWARLPYDEVADPDHGGWGYPRRRTMPDNHAALCTSEKRSLDSEKMTAIHATTGTQAIAIAAGAGRWTAMLGTRPLAKALTDAPATDRAARGSRRCSVEQRMRR